MKITGTVKLKKRIPKAAIYQVIVPGFPFVTLQVDGEVAEGLSDAGDVTIEIPEVKKGRK